MTACSTIPAIPIPGSTVTSGQRRRRPRSDSPWRDWFYQLLRGEGQARNWLGYASLPKLDYRSTGSQRGSMPVKTVSYAHWLKAPWSMDGWRLDVNCICWAKAAGRGITRGISPALPRRRSKRSRKLLSLANILATRASGCRRMPKTRR